MQHCIVSHTLVHKGEVNSCWQLPVQIVKLLLQIRLFVLQGYQVIWDLTDSLYEIWRWQVAVVDLWGNLPLWIYLWVHGCSFRLALCHQAVLYQSHSVECWSLTIFEIDEGRQDDIEWWDRITLECIFVFLHLAFWDSKRSCIITDCVTIDWVVHSSQGVLPIPALLIVLIKDRLYCSHAVEHPWWDFGLPFIVILILVLSKYSPLTFTKTL